LLAPHLGFGGIHGHAWVGAHKGRPMLFARNGPWSLAMASDPPPLRQAVGYVGTSDGWQDFAANGRMTWTYPRTEAGNVAGMAELVLDGGVAQIALGFGGEPDEAGLQASAALAGPFDSAWDEYVGNWHGFLRTVVDPPADLPQEDRDLYMTSASVLRSHQDRNLPGATVASLSIPWGNTRNDIGGYHLVWSRDLVESAGAFVALGAAATARRTLA
jgi:glucoamylase